MIETADGNSAFTGKKDVYRIRKWNILTSHDISQPSCCVWAKKKWPKTVKTRGVCRMWRQPESRHQIVLHRHLWSDLPLLQKSTCRAFVIFTELRDCFYCYDGIVLHVVFTRRAAVGSPFSLHRHKDRWGWGGWTRGSAGPGMWYVVFYSIISTGNNSLEHWSVSHQERSQVLACVIGSRYLITDRTWDYDFGPWAAAEELLHLIPSLPGLDLRPRES